MRSGHTRRAVMGRLAGAAGGVGALSLAACAGPATGESDAARQATMAQASGDFVYTFHQTSEQYQKWMDRFFQEKFPRLTLRYELTPFAEYFAKAVTLIAAGQPVEFMLNHESRAQAFAYRGMLRPLDDYRKRAPFFVPESELFTGSLPSLNWKGKAYAWPNLIANYSIYYNKTIFDRARLPLPTEKWTWGDMALMAQQLTPNAGGGQPEMWGFPEWQDPSWPPGWYPLLRSFGGEHFDKDQNKCVLNEAGGLACLQFMSDMWCRQRATPDPDTLNKALGGTNGVFEAGSGAMRLGGANYYRTLDTKAKGLFEYGIAHMPLGPAGRFMRVGGSQWSIPVTSRHPDVAWEWLRAQVSDVNIVREIAEEQGATVAHIPTYQKYLAPTGETATRSGEMWKKVFVDDLAKHGVTPNYSRVGDQYAPLLGEEVGAMARCAKSAKEASEGIAVRADKFLTETR